MKKYEECSYEAPEKYSDVRLYCAVQIAVYLTYESDEQAISSIKKLETEIGKLGNISSYFSDFYEDPDDTQTVATITSDAFNGKQCRFTVASKKRAKRAATLLPGKEEDDLIAIVFNCSAESRGEYFPVTYRQG